METFCFSIVMFVFTAFGSGCSSQATVENRRPPSSGATAENPSPDGKPRRKETQQQETQEQSNPDRPVETQASMGQPRSYAVSQENSEEEETAGNEETAAQVPTDGGNGETNPADTPTEEETASEEGIGAEEEPDAVDPASAGSTVEADAGSGTEPEADAEPEPPPSDPHAFATEALDVLVRVDSSTVVQPVEMPFWADDALATAAFERANGKIYTVLVYEKREDELFEDWLMRSKVGGTRVSWRTVYARYGRIGYVYASDDYGAVPNAHIVVPSDRFVYYFRSQEETFHVPDDFVDFIREVEVQ